ncbi:pyruvate, phosphate dikinase [Streptomyces xinghaiensis]|uniref:Pyruvate, phosphate dikinase n=2 Tax=Streptomyces TaxID=1883 RepID=A0A3M8FEJ9_9ACTN|nr:MULTISPECIES: pyruvate, phosphate dikinase [Streptomyces]KNE83992.1 pyruvate phosphate dikinase [Streptomyces fradiae]OFA60998.1 pyruvate, phosphate dikinase [Streptomyces fradiae]PQM24677.1 pyruvate, phosphate dikinase [Streptomyces xinghaiensis]RKM98731.1 pyruvate, phosphate dikinase [Streptomyces xinghaiensis]RNC76370.1 pyruvate, phosphate dikinase [Streptomyces xinghaiensis]
MVRYVYDFTEGGRDMAGLLGGKGANLAEMTRMGLPVPPGFTVTTEACRAFLATGSEPEGLGIEVAESLAALERSAGRRLGQADDPLLLSVRSGARFSMPGMMETILDIGLNDRSVLGLAEVSGQQRFAWDSYRRLIQMFGSTVMGVDSALFESALAALKEHRGASDDLHLDAADLTGLTETYKEIIRRETGEEFPQEPEEQLQRAIRAVFDSWNGERARIYRRREHISDDLGTAVNVQRMVFGNLGPDSGSGVAFTRDPATGRPGIYGDYLANAQGEDVVAGIRNTVPLEDLGKTDPTSYAQLREYLQTLEDHYRDLCDIEFTIERGTLWMLQTRVGKRTAEAAFAIASELADEGMVSEDEALARVSGDRLARLMFPRFDTEAVGATLAHGIPASPGAAVGVAVFDSAEAVRRAAAGEKVVLVRQETTPDDLPGMIAAQAILTSRGGKTSHAAVVARGMGKVCVCGAEELTVDVDARRFTTNGTTVTEGTEISVDGSAGTVLLGAAPLIDSVVMRYFEDGGRIAEDATAAAATTAAGEDSAPVVAAVDRLMRRADSVRRLQVRANADTPEDAERARRFGAQGIGLCRTEHMFLGDRRKLVESMILATTDEERGAALAALLPLQREDFTGILAAMDGLPVTIRLLDPPLHEFLPDRTELSVRVASTVARGETPEPHDVELLAAVNRMHEENPMLGLRGVRLGLVVPGLFAMQVRAIAEAVVERKRAGGDPRAEIMVPLVDTVKELSLVREEAEEVLAEVSKASGVTVDLPIGTMIELPRAALTAGRIAEAAEFFSFGTNDLTQTTWGFSRDDVEAEFFSAYLEKGIFPVSPFETLDREGVGRLVEIAVAEGRAARPDLKIGVCGEHGGDPDSVHFFHGAGLDYVSCSPFRVPVARLEAGRAAIPDDGTDTTK